MTGWNYAPTLLRMAVAASLAALGAIGGPASGRPSADRVQTSQPPQGEWQSFAPEPGTHPSRTMVLMMPAEEGRLAERIAAAIRRNSQWFATYAAQHPGGTLPYHANLGLSQAEYERYLSLMKQHRLGEVERGQLRVTRTADGGLQLSSSGHAAYLNGIVIHLDRNYVETRHGRLTDSKAVDQTDPTSPTGAWRGVRWLNADQTGGLRVQLALGRRADGERLIYYSADPSTDEVLFLLYK